MNHKDIDNPCGSGGFSRRHFLKTTAAFGALALLTPTSRVFGANNRLRIAVCGVRSRGNALMGSCAGEPDVEIAWIIDPDRNLLEQRSQEIEERTGIKPRTAADVRRALDDPSVDAIVVATPNHWHSLMAIWAAQAGKHCYVEKPASQDFYEGGVALAAAKKYGVVIQHGTQRRSAQSYADLVQAIRSGKYGKLTVSHAFACKKRAGIGHAEISNPPEWLDWNLWRGPANVDRFHANLVHYNWHWFWVTGNGDLNNQGTHQLDVAFWALDPEMSETYPVKVHSLGGRFAWDDQGETPNTQFAVAEYANGQKVAMNVRNVDYEGYEKQVENRFYFDDGGRIVGDEYISPDGERRPVEGEPAIVTPGGPIGSFVRACRAGKPEMANGAMAEGHYSSALGHLMNISHRLGVEAPFNAKAGRFGDDSRIAEEFLDFHEIMRDGVGLPEDEEKYTVGPWLTFDPKAERFTGENAAAANALLRNERRDGFVIPDPAKV